MVKDTTLYNRLEVEPNADDSVIKKSYNKLSKIWHPDKHGDEKKEEATLKFKEITEARDILLDKEKRNMYDQVGMDILKQNEGQPGPGFNPFGDMFGGSPFGFMPGQQKQGPEHIVETINVTLEQLYKEESVSFTYKQKVVCPPCDGEGSKDGKPTMCTTCNGKGMRVQVIRMGPMIQQAVSQCNVCEGKGKMIEDKNKCETCHAKCYTTKEKMIMIPLKSGLNNGNKINLPGKGHQLKNMKTDLIVEIRVNQHKVFKRYMDDLFVDVDLKLYQALFGFDKIITHLDGRKLHISSSSKTDVNMFRKLAGEGMKSLNNMKGDMFIRFTMILPNLTNLPLDTKNNIKNVLQTFDKNEVSIENNVKTTQNLVKTVISDCKPEHCDMLLNLINKMNETDNSEEQHQEEHMQGQPQCVQQ